MYVNAHLNTCRYIRRRIHIFQYRSMYARPHISYVHIDREWESILWMELQGLLTEVLGALWAERVECSGRFRRPDCKGYPLVWYPNPPSTQILGP